MTNPEPAKEEKSFATSANFVILAIFVCAAIAVLRPVPIVSLAECETVNGVLAAVSEGGTNDVCLRIESHPYKMFYINRGIESGLDIEELQNKLVGKNVTIAHPNYWTPFDPFSSTRHVSRLTTGDLVLFDETSN